MTVYAKAIEIQSKAPILKDKNLEKLIEQLDPLLVSLDSKMADRLRRRAIDPRITIHMPLRAKKYDQYAILLGN